MERKTHNLIQILSSNIVVVSSNISTDLFTQTVLWTVPEATLCGPAPSIFGRRTSHNHLYLKESTPKPQELDVETILWNSTHCHESPLDCGLLFTTSERMPSAGPGRTDELGSSTSLSLVPTRT